jgi:hypothetical protein
VKEIADRLGHSSPTITMRTYAHVLPSLEVRLRDGLENTFWTARSMANEDEAGPNPPLALLRGAEGALRSAALTCDFPRADDGIRTRDPHLGKVAGPGLLTCGDGPICPVGRALSFLSNPVILRRFSVVHGTPTGPLTSPGLGCRSP